VEVRTCSRNSRNSEGPFNAGIFAALIGRLNLPAEDAAEHGANQVEREAEEVDSQTIAFIS
jgi:hypothetical protein